MLKRLLLVLFFSTSLFACALCRLTCPVVYIYTTIIPKEHSTTLDIIWQFHPNFTPALVIYDKNSNNKFEKSEKKVIKKSIEDYIVPKHYLTDIEYVSKNEKFHKKFLKKFVLNYSKVTFDKKKALRYEYNVDIPIVLKKGQKLHLDFFDSNYNFNFMIKDVIVKNYKDFVRIEPDGNNIYTTVYFYHKAKHISTAKNLSLKEDTKNTNLLPIKKIEKKTDKNSSNTKCFHKIFRR